MNDDIYILKENTDQAGMQNDSPCCKSSWFPPVFPVIFCNSI